MKYILMAIIRLLSVVLFRHFFHLVAVLNLRAATTLMKPSIDLVFLKVFGYRQNASPNATPIMMVATTLYPKNLKPNPKRSYFG